MFLPQTSLHEKSKPKQIPALLVTISKTSTIPQATDEFHVSSDTFPEGVSSL